MSGRNREGTILYGGIACSDNKRDLYEVAGFPADLEFSNFYSQFRRNGFARAAVMRPVQKCWSSMPKIYDHKGEGEPKVLNTPFMQDINHLIDELDLFKWMNSLDYRQRVGRYGGIIVIADEKAGNTSKDPLMVVGGVKGIKSLRPVFEGQIEHDEIEYDVASPDFGNPISYSFRPNNASTSTKSVNEGTSNIHKSRIFVCAEGADDGSIFGTSCLEPGFNALMDLLKIQVSSAEGLYKNARQRLHVNIKDQSVADMMLNSDSEEADDFNEALKHTAAGFDNEIVTAGMELKVLQASISEPTGAANIALQAFCVSIGIPKTILIGFETGERSSSENKSDYNETMNSRRNNWCTEMLKDFINYLIGIKAVRPPTHGICIEWEDLNSATDDEKISLAEKMTSINEKSIRGGNGPVFSNDEIRAASGYEMVDLPEFDEGEDDFEDEDDELEK